MSMILYYSKNNLASTDLLRKLTQAGVIQPNLIIALCVDDRKQDPTTKKWYLFPYNILCPNLHTIPALMLIKENNRIIYQKQNIEAYLVPLFQQKTAQATNFAQEPEPFGYKDGSSGIISDSYSHLDDKPEDLSTENGNASMRQLRHYASLQESEKLPDFANHPNQQQHYSSPNTNNTTYQPPNTTYQPPNTTYQGQQGQQQGGQQGGQGQLPTWLSPQKIEKQVDQLKSDNAKQMQYIQDQRARDNELLIKNIPRTY